MSRPHPADRQLLFALLAYQCDFLDRNALVAALEGWAADKVRPIGRSLAARGALDPAAAGLLEALVGCHLASHGGDATASLAALSSLGSVRPELERLADPEIRASLPPAVATFAEPTAAYAGRAPAAGARFRVLRPHARGGLGMVSVALDEELHREVALKEIRPEHVDHPASRSRFVLEAEITGGLEHPGIVPIYGLGTDGAGRPYYAMRLIKGESLKDAIRRFHQADRAPGRDPGERALALRGLLGRFLGVCNAVAYAHSRGVLHRDLKPANVMLGPFGETLVVDWGLAKVVGRPEADGADGEPTLHPPSASGGAETVPGAAIGTPAYMSPEQAEGQLDRLGPRSDVYSLGATLYGLLTGRAPVVDGSEADVLGRVARGDFPPPRQVNSTVPRSLEAICLKAMALDPQDRYESARALAGDLERWLADEPVLAYREPLSARVGRWLRRHRVLVSSSSVALVVALIGLSVVLVVQSRARRLAEAQTDLALAAIREYYTGVSEEVLLNQPGMKELRTKLLQAPLQFYRQLKATLERGRADDNKSLARLADASFALGKISDQVGSHADAETAFGDARAIFAQLRDAQPGVLAYQDSLARSHNNLGLLYGNTGRLGPAETAFLTALGIWEPLARAQPGFVAYQRALADSYINLGSLYRASRRSAEAETAYGAALAILKPLARAEPPVPEYQSELAMAHNNLGNLYRATGRSAEAEVEHGAALAVRARLVREHPGVSAYESDLATSHNNLGVLYFETRGPEPAEAAFRAALAIRARLAREHPGVAAFQEDLAGSHNNLGNLYRAIGRPAPAEAAYGAALTICAQLAAAHPGVLPYQVALADGHNNLGALYRATNRPAGAEAEFRAALAIRERLVREQPNIEEYAISRGGLYGNLGHIAQDRGRPEEALAWYGRSMAALEAVSAGEPRHPTARQYLHNAHVGRAETLLRLGRPGKALADWDRAIELDDGRDRDEIRLWRAITLAHAGQVRRAVSEADALESAAAAPSPTLYNLACLRAQLAASLRYDDATPAAERAHRVDEQAARAVALLERARAAGFFNDKANRDHLKADPDLDPLRDRADFRALLADLEFPAWPFPSANPARTRR